MTDFAPDRNYCPNCQSELLGQYCYSCGQNQQGYDRFFWTVLNELFDNIFSKRSRIFLTLYYLLLKPGFLAVEYYSGRRARYLQPLKLYVLTSLVFFTLLTLSNLLADKSEISPGTATDTEQPITVTDKNKTLAEIEEHLAGLDIEFLSPENNEFLRKRMLVQMTLLIEDATTGSKSFIRGFIESAPLGLFFLVPLFALILKLFYLSSGLYYTQHLILTVYNHSFLFLVLSLNILLDPLEGASSVTGFLITLIEYWTVIYIFLSLKVAYKQNIVLTLVKFSFLGLLYIFLFIIMFIALFMWNLLFI